MKITITGSLGNISKPLTEELLQKGHTVTLITSKPDRQKEIEAIGAKAAIGNIEDVAFLTAAFTGADAVYTMIPPSAHGFTDASFDVMEYCKTLGNNFVQAVKQAGVKRVVHLSSIGAHMEKDSGLIYLHYVMESILSTLTEDVGVTFMRPVGFYYNLLGFIPAIKNMGVIASNYGGSKNKPWVSPIDIAAAIAEEIVTPLKGRKVVYVASDEISCDEIAGILGEAIGKPDLKWILIPGEQLQSGMEKAGLPKQVAAGLVEMNEAIQNGLLYEDYYRNRPKLGKVKMKDYAREFAAAFKS